MSCLFCFDLPTLKFPRLLILLCNNSSVKSPETSVNQFLLALRRLWGKQMESKPLWHVLIWMSEWCCAPLCADTVFCCRSKFLSPLAASVWAPRMNALCITFQGNVYHKQCKMEAFTGIYSSVSLSSAPFLYRNRPNVVIVLKKNKLVVSLMNRKTEKQLD